MAIDAPAVAVVPTASTVHHLSWQSCDGPITYIIYPTGPKRLSRCSPLTRGELHAKETD